MAKATVIPAVPPNAAFGLNALFIINIIAEGISFKLNPNTNNAPNIYNIAIDGTIFSATFDILFIPPKVTNATNTVTIIAVHHKGILKDINAALDIEFTCPNVPIPRSATPTPNTANILAKNLLPRPFSI